VTETDPLRRKALAIIREGRLTVLATWCNWVDCVVDSAVVRVQSSRPGVSPYIVDLLADDEWTCTCRDSAVCPHIRAAQLVTGHTPA